MLLRLGNSWSASHLRVQGREKESCHYHLSNSSSNCHREVWWEPYSFIEIAISIIPPPCILASYLLLFLPQESKQIYYNASNQKLAANDNKLSQTTLFCVHWLAPGGQVLRGNLSWRDSERVRTQEHKEGRINIAPEWWRRGGGAAPAC
jgi:hypothetical protein